MIYEHGYWDLPGGGIEHSETPHTALQCEIKEELGIAITISDNRALHTWTLHDEEYDWPLLFLVYAARAEQQIPSSGSLPKEHIQPFSAHELISLPIAPYLESVRPKLIGMAKINTNPLPKRKEYLCT